MHGMMAGLNAWLMRLDQRSKTGSKLCAGYIALYFLAATRGVLDDLTILSTYPHDSGIGSTIWLPLGPEHSFIAWTVFPWNFIIVPFARCLGLMIWWEHMSSAYILNNVRIFLVFLPGAILNTAIAYQIGKVIDNHFDTH